MDTRGIYFDVILLQTQDIVFRSIVWKISLVDYYPTN